MHFWWASFLQWKYSGCFFFEIIGSGLCEFASFVDNAAILKSRLSVFNNTYSYKNKKSAQYYLNIDIATALPLITKAVFLSKYCTTKAKFKPITLLYPITLSWLMSFFTKRQVWFKKKQKHKIYTSLKIK